MAVMKFSALGDIAMKLPFLRAVEKPFCIITSPIGKAFLEDEFSDFIVLKNKSLLSHLRLILEIRKRRFSNLIDLQGNDRSRFINACSAARIHNKYVASSPLVDAIEARMEQAVTFEKKERTYIVFNTGSSAKWTSKRLPAEKWREFAEVVNRRYGLPIKLTGSSDEVEYVNSIAGELPGDIEVLAGKTSLIEIKTLLANAFLTVSTDSAALHISAVQGTPSIGVFGATPWFIPPYRPWLTCIYDHTFYPDGIRPKQAQPEVRRYYDHIDLEEGLNTLKVYIE